MSSGGRKLIILGIASALIALATTGISLAIYHNSGDIYLDRSRPGFLPDEDEKGDDNNNLSDSRYNDSCGHGNGKWHHMDVLN